jgi:glycosyltransferase involved in cell wall biosynthesis
MPSRGEGFGFVVVEALACGIPVVVSSSDGTREAVRDGALGIIVDPTNPDELVRGTLAALNRAKEVPIGLSYFAFGRFAERLRNALARVVDLAPAPAVDRPDQPASLPPAWPNAR